jgi:hypothetical protein
MLTRLVALLVGLVRGSRRPAWRTSVPLHQTCWYNDIVGLQMLMTAQAVGVELKAKF